MASANPNEVIVTLTNANVKSKHIYITAARHLMPRDVVGGSRKTDLASRLLTVVFEPGQTVQTDIPSDAKTGSPRNFFRERAAVADFLERIGAQAGDEVRIRRTAPHTFHISRA